MVYGISSEPFILKYSMSLFDPYMAPAASLPMMLIFFPLRCSVKPSAGFPTVSPATLMLIL